MNNKLHIASIVFAATAALSSCNDSYPGLNYDYGGDKITNNETYDKTPLKVFVNEQNFFSVSATRGGNDQMGDGLGPLDVSNYEKPIFHVFSFRAKPYSQPVELKGDVDFTHTLWKADGKYNEDYDLRDCLLDGWNYDFGMPVRLTRDMSGGFDVIKQLEDDEVGLVPEIPEETKDREYFYSAKYQNAGYNFFAYHIDNLYHTDHTNDITPHREAAAIWYDIKIDGTQDIMCGSAPDLTRNDIKEKYKLELTKQEIDEILNAGGYSTIAAHRGVYPIVDMKHMFSQLKFEAVPGDEECNRITITGIEVIAPDRGVLTVVSREKDKIGYKAVGDNASLWLKEATKKITDPESGKVLGYESSPLDKEKYKLVWDENCYDETGKVKDLFNRPVTPIGGSIMLPPQDSYEIRLHFDQELKQTTDGSTKTQPLVAKYYIKSPTAGDDGNPLFKSGYVYTIHIAVYGLQEIKMAASIEGWKEDEGGVDVNPDDPEYDNNPDDPYDDDNLFAE